jgi:hypothetical protein
LACPLALDGTFDRLHVLGLNKALKFQAPPECCPFVVCATRGAPLFRKAHTGACVSAERPSSAFKPPRSVSESLRRSARGIGMGRFTVLWRAPAARAGIEWGFLLGVDLGSSATSQVTSSWPAGSADPRNLRQRQERRSHELPRSAHPRHAQVFTFSRVINSQFTVSSVRVVIW